MNIGDLIAFGLLTIMMPYLFNLHAYAIKEYKRNGKQYLTYWLTVVLIIALDILAILLFISLVTSNLH